MSRFDELAVVMGMINAVVVGLVGCTLVFVVDLSHAAAAAPFLLPAVIPTLIGQCLFHKLYERKAQSLMILTHLGYTVWIFVVWMYSIGPFATDAQASLGILFAPFYAAPFLLILWITACVWNGPMGNGGGERRSCHGPLVVIPEEREEEAEKLE